MCKIKDLKIRRSALSHGSFHCEKFQVSSFNIKLNSSTAHDGYNAIQWNHFDHSKHC